MKMVAPRSEQFTPLTTENCALHTPASREHTHGCFSVADPCGLPLQPHGSSFQLRDSRLTFKYGALRLTIGRPEIGGGESKARAPERDNHQ